MIVGNVTETKADLVVYSDGYGWEHGADPSVCSIFLPGVPKGNEWGEWALKEVASTATPAPNTIVYYKRQ